VLRELEPAVSSPFRYPEGSHGSAELRYRSGLPVLTVGGSPEEVGEAVGVLAMRPAQRMLDYPRDSLAMYRAGWLHGVLAWLGERLVRRFPAEYHRELEGMVRGSGIERAQAVVGNTLFDIKKFFACSALLVEAERSATGAPLMGRNLDYPSLGYAHEYGLVTVYRSAGTGSNGRQRFAFASVGFPGLVGCLSGMNEAGLCVAVLECFQAPLFTCRINLAGITYGVCIRRMLESCATIDEAKALLKRLRRTTLFNLALADRERVAVLEVTTRRVVERPARRGACVCTNHFCTEAMRPAWQRNIYTTLDRHAVLAQAERGCERFGVAELHQGLHAASQPDETLQTMVFEPAKGRLYLAMGTCPSSAGPLRTLEVGALFAA
jgi:predicted choloylglycine hydrolase